MSGMSLATGKRVPPEAAVEGPAQAVAKSSTEKQQKLEITFLRVQLLVYIFVFIFSGLVPLETIVSVAFITLYALGLARLVFPPPKGSPADKKLFSHKKWYPAYMAASTTIGLFLPLAYVLGAFARGDQNALHSAIPPVFLTACQLLTEDVIVEFPWVSLPVRALIPLLYIWNRLNVIMTWVMISFSAKTTTTGPKYWLIFNRSLAAANLVFFSLNLFLFVIPMFLPRAFERHYELQRAVKEKRKPAQGKASYESAASPAAPEEAEAVGKQKMI